MPEVSITEASDNLSAAVAGLATNEEQRVRLQQAMSDYLNAINGTVTRLAIQAGEMSVLKQQQAIADLDVRFQTLLSLVTELLGRDHE